MREQFVAETLPVGWPWRLLVFSIIILALAVFAYFGLRFGYRNFLIDQAAGLDRQLDLLSQEVSLEEQEQFVSFYSQIFNLKSVLEKHPFAGNIFSFLERNTVNALYFSEADADVHEGRLNLKGFANSFDALAQQVAIFEKASGILLVLVKDVNLQGGGVSFTLTVDFKPEFFSKPF